MAQLYGVYALITLVLSLINLGLGVWIFFTKRAGTKRFFGCLALINGLAGTAYFLVMMSPTESQGLFWAQVAFSGVSFSPALFFMSITQYRGKPYDEQVVIIAIVFISVLFASMAWLYPETFFAAFHLTYVGQVKVESSQLTGWFFAYQIYSTFVLAAIGGIVMRFLDMDAIFSPTQLFAIAGTVILFQSLTIPIDAQINGYPIPRLAAITIPLNTLVLIWIFIIKQPPLKGANPPLITGSLWHDIRNLTGALTDHAFALREQTSLPPEARQQLLQIEQATVQLQGYLQQTNQTPSAFAPEDVLVNDIIRQQCNLWRAKATEKQLLLSADISEEMTILTLDYWGFKRVLDNLLHNAIKYTPSGGKITLRTVPKHDYFLLEIQDTGIGIPTADQARIFQKGYRASNVREMSGEGLGLSMVMDFVKQHSGTLRLDSHEKQGTIISITLPID